MPGDTQCLVWIKICTFPIDTTVQVIFPCILVHTQCVTKYKISSFSTENLQKQKQKTNQFAVYIVASFMLFTKRRGGGTGGK